MIMTMHNSSLGYSFISKYYKTIMDAQGRSNVSRMPFFEQAFAFRLIIYFNNKMAACLSCRTLVEILKTEINDLSAKGEQLVRVNNALTEALRKSENVVRLQESSWKQKYEQEAKANIELRRRLAELENHQKSNFYSTFDEPATPKKHTKTSDFQSNSRRKSCNNQNHRSNSISRMDEFMKAVAVPKVGQFSTRRNTLTNIKKNKGQIVLRIVDERLNRKY